MPDRSLRGARPDTTTWRRLPPAFLDPRVSDDDLQEAWTKGAEEAVLRLREAVRTLHAELLEAQEALNRAEEFAAHAREVRDRYRSGRTATATATAAEPNRALPRP